MSLINDALKRAKQAQQESAPATSAAPTQLRPVEAQAVGNDPTWWIWPVAILLFLVLFGGLFFVISSALHPTKPAMTVAAAVPPPVPQVVVAPPVDPPKPPPVAVALAKTPKPARIQGIVYDPVNPWAIISGKTIRIGDSVDGLRVTAISRDAIMLTGNGQTNQLRVGDK